jgi:ABC-type transport system substrate-binding protein
MRAGAGGSPFRRASADAKMTRFTSADGSAAPPGKPREIVEQLFSDSASALRALRRGEITIVDRVGPWDAAALAASREVVVEAYRPTTLHLLIPNLRRPLMQTSIARRSVAHAIDRFGILSDRFSRGKPPAGCEIVDELLAIAGSDTTMGEASAGLRYDASVAKLLTSYAISARSLVNEARTGPSTELVLAHPGDEIARMAVQAIAEQIRVAGMSVRPQEESANSRQASYDDADLIYVEWTPLDPLAELPRLLGRNGIGGDTGPIVERLLHNAAPGGPAKQGERLARLNSAISDLTLAIPLWRLNNYLAYRRGLTGISQRPDALYQDVEQWRIATVGASK